MKDKDIDKFFSDDLSREYPYEPKAGDWTKVAQDLDLIVHTDQNRGRFARLVLPLLLSVLLVSILGYGWWYSHRQVEILGQKVAGLESQISMLKTQATVSEDQVRGVVSSTSVLPKSLSFSMPTQNMGQTSLNPRVFPQQIGNLTQHMLGVVKVETTDIDTVTADRGVSDFNIHLIQSDLEPLPSIGIAAVVLQQANPKINAVEGYIWPPIVPLKTKQWGLGIVAGGYGSEQHRGGYVAGKTIGITGQYGLNKRWQLRAGVVFDLAHSSRRPPFNNSDIPIPSAPAVGYNLDRWKTQQMGGTLSLGLRRDFFAHKRLHPYLGADVLGTWFFAEDNDFVFEKNTGGEPHLTLKGGDGKGRFQGDMQMGLGVSYRIRSALCLNLETGWRSSLSGHHRGYDGGAFLNFSLLVR